jgi:dynein heavy chain 1
MEPILEKIQIIVDDMQTRSYSNILMWVSELDKKLENIIIDRLKHAIEIWVKSFLAVGNTNNNENSNSNTTSNNNNDGSDRSSKKGYNIPDESDLSVKSLHSNTSHQPTTTTTTAAVEVEVPLILDQTVYEILLSNQLLFLSPPLEQARVEWIAALHHYIGRRVNCSSGCCRVVVVFLLCYLLLC